MTEKNNVANIGRELGIIFDSVPAWIFYKDKENRFVRVNRAFSDAMKIPKEKLEGVSLFDIYPKEQAEKYWNDDLEVMRTGEPRHGIIEPMLGPSGDMWLETHKIPYKDDKGNVIGVIGFSIDITERHEAEEQSRSARSYLNIVVNSILDPIFVKDREHRWVLFNDAFCSFMGRRREDIMGRSDYEFFPKEEADVFWKKDEEVFNNRDINVNEERFTDAKGVTHVISTKKSFFTIGGEKDFIVGVIRDITDIRSAEEELKKKLHDLEVFQKATLDREKKVIELKNKVAELEDKLKRAGLEL